MILGFYSYWVEKENDCQYQNINLRAAFVHVVAGNFYFSTLLIAIFFVFIFEQKILNKS